MRIILTGATGFIGKSLGIRLAAEGHELVALVRNPELAKLALPFPCECYTWDPLVEDRNAILKDLIKSCDAVVHLAGESVAEGRWSAERKALLLESRTKTTRSLYDLLAKLPGRKPKIFVAASAVGFYGSQADRELDENSVAGNDFLAQLCKHWERELFSHNLPDLRLTVLRFGAVLGRGGGALGKLIPLFKSGGASVLGDGKQWFSWIHKQDLQNLLLFALNNPQVQGVINAAAPAPVTNREFTQTLGRRLGVWRLPAVPNFALRLVTGEMAEMLLASQRVVPMRALALGFQFRFANLDKALHELCYEVECSRGAFAEEFLSEQFIARPPEELWNFFTSPTNLEKITPPFLHFHIPDAPEVALQEGSVLDYRLRLHGIPIKWRSRIMDYKTNHRFVDMQLKGPYSLWYHSHMFTPLHKGTLITDRIFYRLPFSFAGSLVAGAWVRSQLEEIFYFRRKIIRDLFS